MMPKKFTRTHPWITFTLNTQQLPATVWLLLGEAASKIEHLAGVPLRPKTAVELNEIYLAKGVHGTTAIEGNTLSEAQVRQQIEGTLTLPRSQEYLGQEVQNVVDAFNGLTEEVL